MSCSENCNAVREAPGERDPGEGASALSAPRVPGGRTVAGGVVSASSSLARAGYRHHRGATGLGGAAPAPRLLEVLRSAAPHGASVEPQAGASRVLRAAPEFTPPHEAPRPRAAAPAAGGPDDPQRDLGARLHAGRA